MALCLAKSLMFANIILSLSEANLAWNVSWYFDLSHDTLSHD